MPEQCEVNCLPHFTPEMAGNVKGGKLSSYSIALEAWRRGLKVVIHDQRMLRYTIYAKRQRWRYGFTVNLNSKTSPVLSIDPAVKNFTFRRSKIIDRYDKLTRYICINKDIAKQWMSKARVPVPDGERFNSFIPDENIIKYVLGKLDFPVVLKPAAGSLGNGVFVNIKNEKMLRELLVHVRKELGYGDVIVEEHVTGEDHRLFVLGDSVLSVVKRVPANVIGDGQHTVKELIDRKNCLRESNPFLASGLIKIDREVLDCIAGSGYNLDSIPEKDTALFLRRISNLSAGGDPIDVTDNISKEIKNLAVRAVKAIPHLHSAGVDILIDKNEDGEETGMVIELNSMAHIGFHLFPIKGKARDIPAAIVDYCFPESVRRKGRCDRLYFDPDLAVEQIARGIVSEVSLKPPPPGKVRYRCLELKGGLKDQDLKNRLQRRVLKLKLHGFAKELANGNSQIVLAGGKKNLKSFKRYLTRRLEGKIVSDTEWKKAVAAGFWLH